jgi:class 3 adenylate cyclase
VHRQIAALKRRLPASPPPLWGTPSPDAARLADERRIVTILFADIVGSTALAERLDPEDWRRIVATIHGMAGDQVLKHHGVVVQYLGDGLLALFGAQTASEADTENAVRAALDIDWSGCPPINPGANAAGVHTGLVVVGDLAQTPGRVHRFAMR